MQITSASSSRPIHPHILVDVGALGLPVIALIDTGADTNTISYDFWDSLGQPHLKSTKLQVSGFFGQSTTLLGVCHLPMYVYGYNCHHEFNVFLKNILDTHIILGQPWQQSFDCTLKWCKNVACLVQKGEKLLIPFTPSKTIAATKEDELPMVNNHLPMD